MHKFEVLTWIFKKQFGKKEKSEILVKFTVKMIEDAVHKSVIFSEKSAPVILSLFADLNGISIKYLRRK